MKVLQVIDSLAPAGAETIVCQMSQSLREVGVLSEIYALRRTGSWLESECHTNGIPVYYSRIVNLNSPRQADELQSHVRGRGYDLVHVHLFPAQLWGALAAKLGKWNMPLVTTEHSTANRRRHRAFKPIERWMYRQYDALVGVSEGTSNALGDWMTSLSGRITTIHNGVRLGFIASVSATDVKRELGIGDRFLAVSVGRCEEPKNYECSIRAIAETKDVHLAIVGDGTLLPRLRELASSLGVADRIHFLGRRHDVISILRGADFCIQASRWEGFGIAAVEAMAVGLPMLVANVPGLGDVVANAGLKFRPDNHHELAACIESVISDSKLRAALAFASRERAIDFDISGTTQQYADLYRSLLFPN